MRADDFEFFLGGSNDQLKTLGELFNLPIGGLEKRFAWALFFIFKNWLARLKNLKALKFAKLLGVHPALSTFQANILWPGLSARNCLLQLWPVGLVWLYISCQNRCQMRVGGSYLKMAATHCVLNLS